MTIYPPFCKIHKDEELVNIEYGSLWGCKLCEHSYENDEVVWKTEDKK